MLTIHRDTEQLARLVAARSGTTPEDVVRSAVEERAFAIGLVPPRKGNASDLNPATKADLIAGMEAIAARSASRPIADPRSIDEIIGYDDVGLPR